MRHMKGMWKAMAKKKDITRNPPSKIEIGMFILALVIIVCIAFPIFYMLNTQTRLFNKCVKLQEQMRIDIAEWKAANGKDDRYVLTDDDLAEIYPDGVPCCPRDGERLYVVLYNGTYGNVMCSKSGHANTNIGTSSTRAPSTTASPGN